MGTKLNEDAQAPLPVFFLHVMPVRMQHLGVRGGADGPGTWRARGEPCIASQRGVGVYDGNAKDAARQCGTLVLTDRRLAYVDDARPHEHSLELALADITQSEHFAGFLTSSPKIVLQIAVRAAVYPWTCALCRTENAAADGICISCGAQGEPPRRACPACTYANARDAPHCDMCATPLVTPAAAETKLECGGDRAFYTQLRSTLQARVRAPSSARASGAGIDALVTHAAAAQHAQRGSMAASLADLETLIGQAARMTALAAELRTRLERGGHAADDSLLHSALVRLGLPAPAVTPEMVRDEKEYRAELAAELACVLRGTPDTPGLLGMRGVLTLDEVWGVWNRVRGVALIAPDVFREAADMLPSVTDPPIAVRRLRSGLTVLHTAHFSDACFAARICALLQTADPSSRGLSTAEIAVREALPPLLAHELLDAAQQTGVVVRDECAGHVRWFCNAIDR